MARPGDDLEASSRRRSRALVACAALIMLAAPIDGLRAEGGGGGGGADYQYRAPEVERRAPTVNRRPAGDRVPVGRPDRPRRPGGGLDVGIGAGVIGGLIFDQLRRPPVHDPYEPRRPRRPVIVEDYEEEPVLRRPRRPVREAAPPQRRKPERTRRAASPPKPPARTARPAPRAPGIIVPAAAETRFVAEEILFSLAPNAQADAVLRRHRAELIASRRFELAGATIIRARLNGGRTARTVLRQMAGDARVASAQPNYVYTLQQAQAATAGGPALAAPDATGGGIRISPPDLPLVAPLAAVAPKRELQPQYIVERLGLGAAHQLSRGDKIRVAVIDSGADTAHPELQGVVVGSYDALGGEARPHAHGTAMAAAILAQAQLQGVAPASRLLAARAFSGGAGPASASGTTFHILSALDWAAQEGARVVNLSFAGPQDRLLSQALAGAKAKGIVAVAAAGNGGAKAAPLYPGADANVIAVTATDADDKAFAQANRGGYVAVAAPGVDVLAAEPQGRYAFSSGTSIAAAHVSGLVALLLEKRPDLDLEGVRKLLMESAVDLGAKGRDPVYGAGRVDAPAALARALPVSSLR